MKNSLLLFFVVVFMLSLLSFDTQNEGVNFNNAGWFNVSKKARYAKKPIMVYIGSDECVTSRRMLDVFKNKDVGNFINENYICTKMNPSNILDYMRTTNWGVVKVPTIVILSPNKKLVSVELGYKNPKNMIKAAEENLKKMGINNYTPTESSEESTNANN